MQRGNRHRSRGASHAAVDCAGRGGKEAGRGRAHTIVKLIQAGWGHRILVGHDTMVYSGQNGKGPEDPPPHMKPMYENTNNYCFLIETVLPYCVSEFGANQADLDKITYDNPRRFFENRQ